jgi:uncharacterized membrane protein YdjX (TVP38/TMEM64 family)
VILAILVAGRLAPLDGPLDRLDGWVRDLGPWGPAAFVAVYIIATVTALPGSVLTVVAGAVFGIWTATVLVSVGSTVGAALCFLFARRFARGPVERWLAGTERFRRLDDMSEELGSVFVAVARLVPLFPFNLLNYGFGLTRVRFGTYVFWSWICMLPGTFLYAAGGGIFRKLTLGQALDAGEIGAVALNVVLLVILVLWARRKLRERSVSGGR